MLTEKWRAISQKGHNDEVLAQNPFNAAALRRLAESDVPVLAFEFARTEADWAPPHSHARGQLFALTEGLLIVETARGRWLFPAGRCAWIPPECMHSARSVGRAAGSMLYFSASASRGLPRQPHVAGESELLFAIVARILGWNPHNQLTSSQSRLIAVMRDEIRRPQEEVLRLPIPRTARLARVAHALLENVADERTLDHWAASEGMSRRTFMRAFSNEIHMPFGQWRQKARLFAALERLGQDESVTDVAIAVGYSSVSAFIEMFRSTLGTTPGQYFLRRTSAKSQLP